jgi:large subunit ribosomal protein L4
MSFAITLDKNCKESGKIALPASYADINPHNLYLYVKAYLSNIRTANAHTKTRSAVSGGGRKPWAQKGGGRARAGSITSPIFVGGGVAWGPKNTINYFQKINVKQKRLALKCAIAEQAAAGKLFVVDSLAVENGKTKDAAKFLKTLGQRDALLVANNFDEKTYLAYRNIQNCYLIDFTEVNAYFVSTYRSVVIEKDAYDKIVKEG